MLYEVIAYIATFIESWMLYLFLNICIGKKEVIKYEYYIAIILDFLIVAVTNYIFGGVGFAFCISFVYELMICSYLFKNKMRTKVFLIILYNMLLVAIDSIVYILTISILKIDYDTIQDMNLVNSISTVISKTLLLVSVYSLSSLWQKGKDKVSFISMLQLYTLPAVSVWLMFLIIDYSTKVQLDSKRIMLLNLTIIGLLFANIFSFFLYNKVEETEQVKFKVELMEEQVKIQEKYFDELKHSYARTSEMYHDFKNHLIIISALFEQNKKQDLNEYLKLLNVDISKNAVPSRTKNTVIDALFYEKSCIAKKHKIPMTIVAEKLDEEILNPIYLCVLLGNAFDNAIEECLRMLENGDTKVFIQAKLYKKVNLIFSITNSSNKPIYENSKIITKKKDTLNHGFGLSNMEHAVKKMGGNSTFGFENNTFTFVTIIPLKKENINE